MEEAGQAGTAAQVQPPPSTARTPMEAPPGPEPIASRLSSSASTPPGSLVDEESGANPGLRLEPLAGWHMPLLNDPAYLPLHPLLQRAVLLTMPQRLLQLLSSVSQERRAKLHQAQTAGRGGSGAAGSPTSSALGSASTTSSPTALAGRGPWPATIVRVCRTPTTWCGPPSRPNTWVCI